jgi:phosphate transport system substrate-binding protein
MLSQVFLIFAVFSSLSGFSGPGSGSAGNPNVVSVGGSSTVQPVSSAVAQLFNRQFSGSFADAQAYGTGTGLKKFVKGELNVAQASRTISTEEVMLARQNGVQFHEITIGYDGITVVVHPENTFASALTVEELKKIWSAGSKITKWNEIRPDWPSTQIVFSGPGANHGTTDFFSVAVTGKEKNLRKDYVTVQDDDYLMLIDRIASERNALGFITFAYYVKNFKRLRALGISANGTTVNPTYGTIVSESYQPLSRRLYLYVAKNELHRPEVESFLQFYLNVAPAIVKKVGYVPLTREAYKEQKDQLDAVVRGLRRDLPVTTR